MTYIVERHFKLGELLSLAVYDAEVSADRTELCLYFGGRRERRVRLSAEADGQSESWFEHVEGIEALKDATIKGVVIKVEGRPVDPPTRQEDEYADVIDLITTKGTCSIEFRNSSNGCYGGYITGTLEQRKDDE